MVSCYIAIRIHTCPDSSGVSTNSRAQNPPVRKKISSLVDAGQFPVPMVLWTAAKKAIHCTAPQRLRISVCRLGKHEVCPCKQPIGSLAAVRGAASPISPLRSARAKAVVPGSVGKHECKLLPENFCQLIQCLSVLGHQSLLPSL